MLFPLLLLGLYLINRQQPALSPPPALPFAMGPGPALPQLPAPAPPPFVGPVGPSAPSSSAPAPIAPAPLAPAPSASAPPAPTPQPHQVRDIQRLDAARKMAVELVPHLRAKGRNYDKQALARFQLAAGLKKDGLYGPKTAGALRWYTNEAVPPFVGSGYAPYAPPF